MPNAIVENYAAALFDVASSKNRIGDYMQQLEDILNAIHTSDDLGKALASPVISDSAKIRVIKRIFANTCDAEVLNFMYIIIKNRRLNRLDGIVKHYAHLYRQYAGIIEAIAVTARPLAQEIIDELKQQLQKTYNKPVYVENIVDPYIIGGMRLSVDGRTIDYSIASRLEAVKSAAKRLAANIYI